MGFPHLKKPPPERSGGLRRDDVAQETSGFRQITGGAQFIAKERRNQAAIVERQNK